MSTYVLESVPDNYGPWIRKRLNRRPDRPGLMGLWDKFYRVKHFWNVRQEDFDLDYPCERYAPGVIEVFMRAIDVDAPPEVSWRWLCQLRMGPYAYDWIDNFGRRSPRELTPGVENLEIGQRMMLIFYLLEFEEGKQVTMKTRAFFWRNIFLTYRVVPLEGNRSRIAQRCVATRRNPFEWLFSRPWPYIECVMTRRQLMNLKEFAEKTARG
jgi:hypothetical protein